VSSVSLGGMVYFALVAVFVASTLVWGWYLFLSLARLLRITVPVSSEEPDRVYARLGYFSGSTAALGLLMVLLAALGVPSM